LVRARRALFIDHHNRIGIGRHHAFEARSLPQGNLFLIPERYDRGSRVAFAGVLSDWASAWAPAGGPLDLLPAASSDLALAAALWVEENSLKVMRRFFRY
jgi:hypothetical protein